MPATLELELEVLPAIPLEHQGLHFTNSKQLRNGQKVIDTFLGWNRICKVIRRFPISVKLQYTDVQGKVCTYTQSLRHLRRAV
jgi:hypothetical protein